MNMKVLLQPLNQKSKIDNNKKITFGSIIFENYNNKYDDIKTLLRTEIERFSNGANNAVLLGEGVSGETYKFTNPRLSKFVIKKNKSGFSEDYSKEFKNLASIPVEKVGGQEAIARVYNNRKDTHYLVSTLVSGKTVSTQNRYTDRSLKILFDKMFELDKVGIYHGDLNGKNILLDGTGNVNFIDYQWTEKVDKNNLFDNVKSQKTLLPVSNFPENAQMFEMASMPWYMENLDSSIDREAFLKQYLRAKANYHEQRYDYIKKITTNWRYSSELPYIKEALDSEKAKAMLFKNPSDGVLKIEMKKLQFLSDYRDAYSHVDPNLPNRNILPAPSAYICSLSSVQDFRKEVSKQSPLFVDQHAKNYIKSMERYGDYWYNNLKNYTNDTFDYIMRAVKKQYKSGEERHEFYINERNPRVFEPNRDLLAKMPSSYRPFYERNFDIPIAGVRIEYRYEGTIDSLKQAKLYDLKTQHNIYKLSRILKETKQFINDKEYLNLLDLSELSILKIREFRSYSKHNQKDPFVLNRIDSLFRDVSRYTHNLFKIIQGGLQQENAKSIIVKGYEEMRKFKYKI